MDKSMPTKGMMLQVGKSGAGELPPTAAAKAGLDIINTKTEPINIIDKIRFVFKIIFKTYPYYNPTFYYPKIIIFLFYAIWQNMSTKIPYIIYAEIIGSAVILY